MPGDGGNEDMAGPRIGRYNVENADVVLREAGERRALGLCRMPTGCRREGQQEKVCRVTMLSYLCPKHQDGCPWVSVGWDYTKPGIHRRRTASLLRRSAVEAEAEEAKKAKYEEKRNALREMEHLVAVCACADGVVLLYFTALARMYQRVLELVLLLRQAREKLEAERAKLALERERKKLEHAKGVSNHPETKPQCHAALLAHERKTPPGLT